MIGYIIWDPSRVFFTIPVLGIPIYWYGLFFALGFLMAYYTFITLLQRHFREHSTEFTVDDIASFSLLREKVSSYPHFDSSKKDDGSLIDQLNKALCKGMSRAKIEHMVEPALFSLRRKAQKWTDKLSFWILLAVVIGARAGHMLFYENPSYYLSNPLTFFMLRKGGLASHGAVIAVLVAIFLYARKRKMQWLVLADLLSIPAAVVGGMIRIGNFFNQEILGKATTVPWAIYFAHPFTGEKAILCHPVQIYESLFYFLLGLLLYVSYHKSFFSRPGRRFALFFSSLFTFRFFVEFFKQEQSQLTDGFFTMGQYLSLPLIGFGILLLWYTRKKDKLLSMESS